MIQAKAIDGPLRSFQQLNHTQTSHCAKVISRTTYWLTAACGLIVATPLFIFLNARWTIANIEIGPWFRFTSTFLIIFARLSVSFAKVQSISPMPEPQETRSSWSLVMAIFLPAFRGKRVAPSPIAAHRPARGLTTAA